MTKITAGRGTLNWADIVKGALVAMATQVFTVAWDSISAGNFNLNWDHIAKIAAVTFLGYLTKNFLTPSQVVISDPAKVEAAKQGETITVTPKIKTDA